MLLQAKELISRLSKKSTSRLTRVFDCTATLTWVNLSEAYSISDAKAGFEAIFQARSILISTRTYPVLQLLLCHCCFPIQAQNSSVTLLHLAGCPKKIP